MIKNAWYGLSSFSNKLQVATDGLSQCQLGLQQWSKDMHKSQGKLLKSKPELLNHLKEINEGQLREEIKSLQKEVDYLLEVENTKWKQRAKQAWLKDGDRNTKFFHECTSQMRKTNTIKRIVNGACQETIDLEEISLTFQQYFSKLFSTSSQVRIEECLPSM